MATVFTGYFGFHGPNTSVDFNRDLLADLLADSGIDGCTITPAQGYYDGEYEPSAVVTVICQDNQASAVDKAFRQVCSSYKHAAEQYSIWLTRRQEDLSVI